MKDEYAISQLTTTLYDMLTLYPDIKPFAEFELEVSGGHRLHVEQSGQPDGLPIVFVHGGPGLGCSPQNRCFFDPSIYRIILFDQRGAGRSTPHASLEQNTTQDLIADMEAIREHLGIESWILFGGSWGSTLSLLYAQAHPDRVMALVLRGIWLVRQQDIDWIYQNGANRIFPDYWAQFTEGLSPQEEANLVCAYYQKLTSDNELEKMGAAKSWSLWEAHCATLNPCQSVIDHLTEPHAAMSFARICCHYVKHHAFIAENQILNNMSDISHIPGVIVQGRYDMLCPPENAFTLHQHWPNSELYLVRDAGHAASEPAIVDALILSLRNLANQFI